MTTTARVADGVIPRVEAVLETVLTERAQALRTLTADCEPLLDAAHRTVLGRGKRLRPLFAYLGWRAATVAESDDQPIVNAAAGLELLHACALVQDDVIDRSAIRRGRPSAHAAFETLHAETGFAGDGAAFGRASAIVLGDLLLAWADRMIMSAGLPPAGLQRARTVYDEMREALVAGQYLDALMQARKACTATEALMVIQYKTSTYTVEGPLLFGAAAAMAGRNLTSALSAYGRRAGEAFQLRDDVLGVFGDPARTGKPTGDDLREGKRTLLVAIAASRANPVQAALLHRHLGDPNLGPADIDRLREVLVDTGALAEVESRISTDVTLAHAVLRDAEISPAARGTLEDLAVRAAHRQT